MVQPFIERLRRARLFLRSVAITVVCAYLGLYLQPVALAARLPAASASTTAKTPATPEEKLSRTLEDIEAQLAQLETKLNQRLDATTEKTRLKTMRQELEALDKQARANFDAIERHLKDKKLPQVILDRHAEAVRTYRSEMVLLKSNLDSLEIAKDDVERKARAQKAREHLKAKQKKRAQQKFDPNDMPNKSLRPDPKNKPKLKKNDFVRAGLFSNPYVKLAAHGNFRIDQLPGASDPAYLAATTEVTLTDAIRAKAAELQHNPVKIYNWVRNNVEWLPTWGATQDADVTLGSQSGNAMDIASLLIALLRASDIPARYVHGTIEVSEDKFRNWAGGFTSITAAADYAASGGIPVTTVVSGGKITKVQLEHIWVEAAIDFHPSRGAINKSADSWTQFDASYKKYEDLQGLDVVAITGINPNTVAQSFATSGTINEQEGWVSGLNPAVLQNAQAQAQTALQTYITNNLPNATVGDVIGGRRILTQTSSVLSSAMPYRSVVIGARYGAIPAALQHTMTFAFGTDLLGERVNPVTFPWPKLNNHKVTLSFKPATAADEQMLTSLLPSGPITDPSQLPSSIPSYLIDVIPEIAVDGQVVGQGSAMRLGEILNFYYGIERVNGQGSHAYTYPVVAGSYLSVAVAGGSVSPTMINNLRVKLTDTQSKLATGDSAIIALLNREDILGDMFYAGTLAYFGQYITLSHVASQPQKAHHNLPSAYGTLGYEPNVQTLFGFPRAIQSGSVVVNVRLNLVIGVLDGNQSRLPALGLQTGLLSSALESAIPEQMFSGQVEATQSISAVRALQLAMQQGQLIYHVTPANQAQTLPNLHLDSVALSEINQALAAGKEVVAHTDRINAAGFTGEGYILFDPASGDGAYKITGGKNGSSMSWCSIIVLAIAAILMAIILAHLLAALIPVLVSTAAAITEVMVWVGAYVEAAMEGLSIAIAAAAAGTLLTVVSSQAAAGDTIGEICTSTNPVPSGLINGEECVYSCPFSKTTIYRPSKVRLTCTGQERYCPDKVTK